VYGSLLQDSWHARNWTDKVRVWFKPPGWRPADVAARFPKPAFDIAKVQRYQPPITRAVAWFGAIEFAALLLGVVVFLWHADSMALPEAAVWLVALATGLWCVGAVLQGRLDWLEVLLIEAAAAAAATSAVGMSEWHHVFKPLALLLALAWVAGRVRRAEKMSITGAALLAGLACSLAGDVLLMLPGLFIPGLVAFLAAHLCYIALFKQGVAWFPSRLALLATLVVGAAMYAFLFDHLGPVLKVAVGAYVVVIALMAAQAIGRATVLRNRASLAVAIGAACFMLSDSLLATNKFAFALPMAQLWVLASYYVAQTLIACNALGETAPERAAEQPAPSGQALPQG
jgi:alkylglycerol monooxygenase